MRPYIRYFVVALILCPLFLGGCTHHCWNRCPMTVDETTGFVQEAKVSLSPNRDARPDPNAVNLLVIHGISLPPGKFGSSDVIDLFMNRLKKKKDPYFASIANLKVSAHFFIRRDGELWQFVPLQQRAWHAGASMFMGQECCNDFSIGVELEGTDDVPYTQAQYDALASLSKALMQRYPQITLDRIVGHSDISPGRKSDPGPSFNWEKFHKALKDI